MRLFLLILAIIFNSSMLEYLESYTNYDRLSPYTWESAGFRAMKLGKNMAKKERIDCDSLASQMVEHNFDLTGIPGHEDFLLRFPVKRPVEFRKLSAAYSMIFDDLAYFPIPLSTNVNTPDVTYEDGWLEKRTYGGDRSHEGCDIMGSRKPRGFYPVVSMTDGTVEKIGWLEKGGWRIGIRSPSGAYFYYAHLYGYDREWKEGDPVKAGTVLGYMGDTGYGAAEGTTGNFPVHLHMGIYVKTDHYEELSVNPYWVLKFMEKYRLKYSY